MTITTDNVLKTIADIKKLGTDAVALAGSSPISSLGKLYTVIGDIQTVIADVKGLLSDPEVAQVQAAALDAIATAAASMHKVE